MRNVVVLLGFCLVGLHAHGQEKQPNNFSISAGVGWFYYVNNLKTQPGLILKDHIGFSSRLLWEPEHRLSLGGEVGYYTIYTVNIDSAGTNIAIGEARLSAIPVLLCFKMRITPHFYVTGGQGLSILLSEAKAFGSTAQSTKLSLADLQFSALYRRPINDRLRIEGEFKYFHFGKTEDYGFCFQAVVSYMFRFKSM